MADITALMVKELRESTGVGMMDAKKALVQNNGNMEKAVDWLRTQGLSKAAKKSGRTAAEGLVAIITDGNKGAVVEVNAETDFVARNEQFQAFVKETATLALNVNNIAELKAADMGGKTVEQRLTDLIAAIGENMALRRMEHISVDQGKIVGYVHGALADGLGKIGVLVALESAVDKNILQDIGKKVAMHVAAANPQFLDKNSVSADVVERERAVLKEQAIASGKPAEIAEKMVEGRMRKFYQEVCLLEQAFIMDTDKTVEQAVKDAGNIEITSFSRLQLGDGVEKKEEDFAAEVAAAINT